MSDATPRSANAPSQRIDWRAVRQRLDAARAALERDGAPTAEETKRVLQARAKALARAPQTHGGEQRQLEVVTCLLAYEHYAIALPYVREVYPLKELTTLPDTPPFVAGIINVRGRIISVVDLKKFFDLPEQGLTNLNTIILVSDGQMEFGLLVDAVTEVRRIPLSEMQPPPLTLTGIRQEYVQGVTSRRLIVLDMAKILTDPRIVVCEETQR